MDAASTSAKVDAIAAELDPPPDSQADVTAKVCYLCSEFPPKNNLVLFKTFKYL